MPVGDCQRDFATAAGQDGLELVPSGSGDLTDAGHLSLSTGRSTEAALLRGMFIALDGDEDDLRRGTHRQLQLDLLHVPTRTPVEIDEYQHFTSDRLLLLEQYPDDIELGFDIAEYIGLCRTHRVRADRYRASKEARGFRRRGGRRAQRAYLDAVRDVGLPTFEYRPVVRVPAIDGDGVAAYRSVRDVLLEMLDEASTEAR